VTDDPTAQAFDAALQQSEELAAALRALKEQAGDELARLTKEVRQGRGRITKLSAEVDELQQAQLQWAVDRQALLEHQEQLGKASEAINQQLAAAATELDSAKGAHDQLRKALQEEKRLHTADQAAAEKGLKAAFQDLNRSQDQLAKVSAELAELKKATSQWPAERESLARKVAVLGDHRDAALAHVAAQEEELAAIREEADKLKAAAAAAKRERQRAGAEAEELQAAQLQWAVDREALIKERDDLRREQKLAAARLGKVGEEAQAALRRQSEDADRLKAELKKATLDLAAEKARLAKELAEAQVKQAAVERRAQEVVAKLQAVSKEVERDKASAQAELARRSDAAARFQLIYQRGHELYSALNPIIGFSDILLEDRSGTSPEERREFVQLINDSGKRLLKTIGEMIELARQEAGIEEHPASRITGGGSVSTSPPTVLVADHDPAARERMEILARAGYELTFVRDADEAVKRAQQLQPIAILLDPQLPPTGASPVVARLKKDARTKDIPVVLTSNVRKDQLGFDISQCEFLTKPIDRQQLLQMMVKFDLLADGSRRPAGPSRILLVDDDPQNVRLVKAMLKPLDIEVLVAAGGKAGIEMALKERPDMMILDLMMPEVDGFEVLAALANDATASQIPILIYTAKTLTAEDQERLQGNIRSVILKGDFARDRFLEIFNKKAAS